jgi:hypothetical protein
MKRYILPTAHAEVQRYITRNYQPTNMTYKELLGTSKGFSVLLGKSTKWNLTNGIQEVKGMYLAPDKAVQGTNFCWNSGACRLSCIRYTGHLGMNMPSHVKHDMHITERRTRALIEHTDRFLSQLIREMISVSHDDMFIRLNGSSDIRWEYILDLQALHDDFGLRFYDYTKIPLKARSPIDGVYRLCYSYDEQRTASKRASEYIAAGYPVSICMTEQDCKKAIKYGIVTDGDAHDIRFVDSGVICLKYKKPTSKGVERINTEFIQTFETCTSLTILTLTHG